MHTHYIWLNRWASYFFFLIVIRKKNNNFFNASPLSNDLIKVVYSLMITCSFQARTKRITHDVINTHTHVYTNEKLKFYLIVDIIVIMLCCIYALVMNVYTTAKVSTVYLFICKVFYIRSSTFRSEHNVIVWQNLHKTTVFI